ncbi:hypothetical protein [Sorangium sp. So ce1151]|uniref:hypothetical protein n=1 Tax=Sorangium sp. So ce1151 TaxID=3133332 RepID=UPI003F64902B
MDAGEHEPRVDRDPREVREVPRHPLVDGATPADDGRGGTGGQAGCMGKSGLPIVVPAAEQPEGFRRRRHGSTANLVDLGDHGIGGRREQPKEALHLLHVPILNRPDSFFRRALSLDCGIPLASGSAELSVREGELTDETGDDEAGWPASEHDVTFATS